jgi:hypothetical protein
VEFLMSEVREEVYPVNLEVAEPQEVQAPEVAVPTAQVALVGKELYVQIITQVKAELQGLVNDGLMAESVANEAFASKQLQVFNEVVRISVTNN